MYLQLYFNLFVSPIINREGGRGGLKGRGGAGGAPGIGGPGGAKGIGGLAGEGGQGGMGLRQNKRFYGKQHHAESCDCNWLHCGLDSRRDWYDEYSKSFDPAEECCQGDQGGRGQYGKDGIDGRGGHNGEEGNQGDFEGEKLRAEGVNDVRGICHYDLRAQS